MFSYPSGKGPGGGILVTIALFSDVVGGSGSMTNSTLSFSNIVAINNTANGRSELLLRRWLQKRESHSLPVPMLWTGGGGGALYVNLDIGIAIEGTGVLSNTDVALTNATLINNTAGGS